jgi:hypothetical protein
MNAATITPSDNKATSEYLNNVETTFACVHCSANYIVVLEFLLFTLSPSDHYKIGKSCSLKSSNSCQQQIFPETLMSLSTYIFTW